VSAICRRLWSVVRPRTVGRAARYLVLAIRFRQLRRRFLAVGRCCEVSIHRSARVTFGRRVRFLRFTTLHVHAGADLRIGDGVSFSPGCTVCVHERLEIGEGSTFGEGVSIHDEDHLRGPFDVPLSRRGFATAPIAIGRNVWIGAKATVLKGVTIGDEAVIGAGAVVTRDVPTRAVAVGVPARVIGRGSVAAVPGEAA
jgi:acetyltransferase-like isoleucine patch superfamily enzyme